jgi:2',3'-cyclic-nucleotide 2'-phosphodiesterase
MKILFVSDIFAKPGRQVINKILPELKKKYDPDLVIGNCENLSHGNGFSSKAILEMQKAGIDFFTSGNHVWGNKSGVAELDNNDFPVIRPYNFPNKVPGRGYEIVKGILIINLTGQVFMKKHYDSPFNAIDEILEKTAHEKLKGIFIDFHAETSSEKYALAYYLDGRVSAIIGTHTHVPTADLRILPKGTAFMTDAGMNGSLDSVIGVKKELIIESFKTQMPVKHEPETSGQMVFNAVLIELDDDGKKALNVEHVQKII